MHIESGYLETNAGRIYYKVAGAGSPFVMLHAGIAHSAMWDLQFEYFARSYRVIRFDQRGFGKTVTLTKEFNRRDDLRALLDHLNVERAILMGCSLGGGVALDFTLEHPDRVSALILIAAGISGTEPPAEIVKQWEAQDEAFRAGDLERVVDLELAMWVDGPGRALGSPDAAVRARVREMELDNLQIDTEDYRSAQLKPPANGRLHEIRVPTLVMVGSADQPFTVKTARRLAREIPGAQFLDIANTAHVPNMERADEVNGRVEEFLRGIGD